MIVLYIFLAPLLLVLLLLFSSLSFIFEYNEKFTFKLRFLFVSLKGEKILNIIESGNSKSDNREEIKKIQKKKKKTLSDTVDLVIFILELIKGIFGEFLRYAKIKLCYIDVKIASDDAASTALLYGVASTAIYSALEFFDTFVLLSKNYKKVSVYPDFTSTDSKAKLKIVIKLKPIHLILAAMHLLPILASQKKGK